MLDLTFNIAVKRYIYTYNLTIPFLAPGPRTKGKPLGIPSAKCCTGTASPFNTAGHQEVICSCKIFSHEFIVIFTRILLIRWGR